MASGEKKKNPELGQMKHTEGKPSSHRRKGVWGGRKGKERKAENRFLKPYLRQKLTFLYL